MNEELIARFKRIRLLALDLDGVLTDGRITYGDGGDQMKSFHMHDGYGMVLLKRGGVPSVIISGKKSKVNRRRARELGVLKLVENVSDKGPAFERILRQFKRKPEEVCFVGDDIIDLSAMRKAGLAVAVQNAVPEVKRAAHYVTRRCGGDGAVREVTDLILEHTGKWREAAGQYLSGA